MNPPQIIFLDTTVQIQRSLADPAQSAKLEALLSAATIKAITAPYVWMEYQRTIIADYAYIHQLMYRYADWGTLLLHLLDGPHAFRLQAAVRCTRIVGKVLKQSNLDWELARQMLGVQVAYSLRDHFWTHVTSVADSIDCTLVREGITRQPDGTFAVAHSCSRETASCHLPDFLTEHKQELQTIAEYLAAHPQAIKDQERVEALLQTVMADPAASLGQASCWPLGDIIIALHVPAEAELWTLDPDFKALAAALGLRLFSTKPRT